MTKAASIAVLLFLLETAVNSTPPSLREQVNAVWLKDSVRKIMEVEGAIAIGGPSVEQPWDGHPINARVLQRVVRILEAKSAIAESELKDMIQSETPFWRVVSYSILSERRKDSGGQRYQLATACSRRPSDDELKGLFP